jgi:hypothetical protein
MDGDAREDMRAGSRDRHLRVAIGGLEKPPQLAGRSMAEHGSGAARLDRGQQAALGRKVAMPNRPNPGVEMMKPPTSTAS